MSHARLFGSLCGLVFLVNLARVVFAPLLEPLMATYGIGPGTAGFVATAAWLGSAAPRLPIGFILTRVPRSRVIVASGGILAVAAVMAALAPTIGWLTVAAFLMGVSSGTYFIAANPLVSELFPDRVGRVMGVHGGAAQIAAVVAAPLVGAAIWAADLRYVFVTITVAALLATAATTVIARRSALPRAGIDDRDLVAGVRAQWRLVLTGVIVVGLTGFAWNGVFNFYVTYLKVAKGLPEPFARDLLMVVFAAGVPAFWLTGRLADRLPRVPLLVVIMTGFAGTLAALLAAGGVASLVLVSITIGYAIHSLFPTIDTYLLDTLPDQHRASAYAAYSASMMLIQATGSSVVGALTAAGLGFDVVFAGLAVGLLGLALSLAAGYLLRYIPRGGSRHRA